MRRFLPFLPAVLLPAVLLLAACTPHPVVAGPHPAVAGPHPVEAGPHTVVTFGDSVPAGTSCGCDPFPALYARQQHTTDVNLSSPGSTSADFLAQIPSSRDVLSSTAEVVVMTGANDIADDVDQPSQYADVAAAVESNVAAAISAIEQIHRMPVIVLGYWNVVLDGQVAAEQYGPDGVRRSTAATAEVNAALQSAASQSGATYISTEKAFHGQDGNHDPTDLLSSDGDHPNAAGHAAIAALLPSVPAPAGS
jgi:acyl-CoA thioesterase-1